MSPADIDGATSAIDPSGAPGDPAAGASAPAPEKLEHDSRPRLRADLIIVEQVQNQKPYFVIKDPTNGKIYGLNAFSHQLIAGLDGATSLEDLSVKLAGGRPDRVETVRAKVMAFAERLRAWGLLVGTVREKEESARIAEKIRKYNPLYLRIGKFDPSPVLRHLDWLFFPLFTVLGALALAAGLASSGVLIGLAWQRFYNTYMVFTFFKSWIWVYVLLTLGTVLHETSHAMACRKYGGEVKEMGFLLYLLQIGCYTNVSDAWLFPKRWHRIVVSFAGVYVEAFLLCGAIWLWYFTRPFSPVNQVSFVVANIFFNRILFNLFPFLRLDGYFILSDLLQVRNLRPRAFTYLLSLLPAVGRHFTAEKRTTLRERTILFFYGILSLASVFLLLSFSLRFLHRVLSAWNPPYGAITFWSLAGVFVGMTLLSLLFNLWRYRRRPEGAAGVGAP